MIRSLLLMLAVSSGASVAAAEPVALIDAQLDRVTAGALDAVNRVSEGGGEVGVLMLWHEGSIDYEVIKDASGFVRVVVHGLGEPVSIAVSEPIDYEVIVASSP